MINKRVKEITNLQIDNLKLEEDNKNTLKIIEEIINDPKTTPEISYSVNKFINNGFTKTSNSFYNIGGSNHNLSENKEGIKDKTLISSGGFNPDENLSQVFSSSFFLCSASNM